VKRALSLLLVGIIVCLIILNPLNIGHQVETHAVGILSGEAIGALMVILGALGLNVQNLGELIDIQNYKSPDFWQAYYDTVLQPFFDNQYEYDPVNGVYGFTIPASGWEDLRNDIADINDQLYEDYELPATEKFIEGKNVRYFQQSSSPSYSIVDNWVGMGMTFASPRYTYTTAAHSTYFNGLLVNTEKTYNNGTNTFVLRVDNNVLSYDTYLGATFVSNSVVENTATGILDYGFVPSLYWAYANGETDAEGYKYRLTRSMIFKGLYNSTYKAREWHIPFGNTTKYKEEDVSQRVAPFGLANDITQMPNLYNIPSGDTVTIEVDSSYYDDFFSAVDAYIANPSAVDPATIAVPSMDTLIKDVSSTNTVINNYYTEAVTVPNTGVIDVDLEFPDISTWEVPSIIQTKFPFSIPWDLKNAVTMMQATAVIPVFTIPFVIPSINFTDEIVLDLTQFDYLAKITRWFILALFMIGLILVTRKLIKG